MTFTCTLDGGAAEPCSSPKSYSGLADGQHTFTVTGTDRWGSADASPAGRTWTVQPPSADRDGDGVLDGSDNCPDNANAGQGDADRDGVGDACEVLPSGNTPVEAGRVATVKLLSGDVFVKLPAGAAGSAFTSGLRVPFQSSGFVSLKGVAAVPMGSTLDTRSRRGRGDRRDQRPAPAQPQAAAPRGALPRGHLRDPAGAQGPQGQALQADPAAGGARQPDRRRAPVPRERPGQGHHRALAHTTAKGVFRTVGGAATATPAKGTTTFSTVDRCDGTLTQVGRGRVAVVAKKTGKRQVVPAGRAYIVRARLFAARKGRNG